MANQIEMGQAVETAVSAWVNQLSLQSRWVTEQHVEKARRWLVAEGITDFPEQLPRLLAYFASDQVRQFQAIISAARLLLEQDPSTLRSAAIMGELLREKQP